MSRAKKSVVYKADTAGLKQLGTSLRPSITTAMDSALTVHGKVHNLDWLGRARDAAFDRADRELVQDRRVGQILGTLADAYVNGAEAMQPMIDTLRRDGQALEDDGFSVSEDWEVKDTYDYDSARKLAPLFGMTVDDVNDIESRRANEAANATARLQPLADELGTADANTKTAITNATTELDTNAPASASTNPAATPGTAPDQASVVKTSATAPRTWQDMVLPPHLRDTAGQPTVDGDVAGKPLSTADAAAAHAQLRQSLAASGMSAQKIDEFMARLPSPEAAAAMLGAKFSPAPQTDKPRAELPGFADRLKDASLRFDQFGRNIGDGLSDTAEATIDGVKGLPNLVGLGGEGAPGVLDSWKAVGEGILGTPEAIVKEVTDVFNPPEGSTWDRELGQVLPEVLGAAGLGKAVLTHAFEHAARDGPDGLPVAETKPTTATSEHNASGTGGTHTASASGGVPADATPGHHTPSGSTWDHSSDGSYSPHAPQLATELNTAYTHGQPIADLVNRVADHSTHHAPGPNADRVVLGRWDGQDGGYIGEARHNGGTYFDTGDATWAAMGHGLNKADTDALAWQVNEARLRMWLEEGVPRIDYTLPEGFTSTQQVAAVFDESFSAKEINFLNEHAAEFGYQQIGASWVKMGIR